MNNIKISEEEVVKAIKKFKDNSYILDEEVLKYLDNQKTLNKLVEAINLETSKFDLGSNARTNKYGIVYEINLPDITFFRFKLKFERKHNIREDGFKKEFIVENIKLSILF